MRLGTVAAGNFGFKAFGTFGGYFGNSL